MLQFSHFDQLFPNVLPIMLQIFHVILAILVENTMYKTKKSSLLQHDRRFDIVVHTAGLPIT